MRITVWLLPHQRSRRAGLGPSAARCRHISVKGFAKEVGLMSALEHLDLSDFSSTDGALDFSALTGLRSLALLRARPCSGHTLLRVWRPHPQHFPPA